MKLIFLILLGFATAFAAEESCEGRCQDGFDPTKKCQCDTMCKYYNSCCGDFYKICQTKIARGDVFDLTEEDLNTTATPTEETAATAPPSALFNTVFPDPEAVTCNGRTFDAFLQLKNGSIFAFRGKYFFELDERSVLPGYPKLIKDVWGISGPIDAAFTRVNCQGKSYIFKGNKYWRFDNDVLDEDYPRNISVGFNNIPDDVDAAFAIPAAGHRGKEKAYFFKGDQYYQYEFKHQPSHEECVEMTKSSPSVLFTHYANLYCHNDWDDLFTVLFGDLAGHHKGPRSISRDWGGISHPIDAAMVGRPHMSAKPSPLPSPSTDTAVVPSRRHTRKRKHRGKGTKQTHSLFWEDWEDFGLDYEERYFGAERRGKDKKNSRGRRPSLSDYIFGLTDYADLEVVENKAMPVQKVYFFKKDKYYRVDLQTKRTDYTNPPYPRSIAKYWLGCKEKDLAEKR